jgi:hypothetical protein
MIRPFGASRQFLAETGLAGQDNLRRAFFVNKRVL